MADKTKVDATFAAVRRVIEETPYYLDFESRRMFGGMGLYVRGRIFLLIMGHGELAFKLPDDQQAELLAVEGVMPCPVSARHYIQVPPSFLDDVERLKSWLSRSAEYALTLPLPERKKRRT